MATEELRELAREEPEAFRSYVEKLPDGELKSALRGVLDDETPEAVDT